MLHGIKGNQGTSSSQTGFAMDGDGALIVRKVVFNDRQERLNDVVGRDGAIDEEEIIMCDA